MIEEKVPKLGFGLMRLPKKGDEIDIEETSRMVDAFLDAGFTYFDTAYVYTGSEEAAKKALVDRHPRDSYTLATKNAAWLTADNIDAVKQQFTTSLERTGAGYFDYYLLHNLGEYRTKVFEDLGLWDWIQELKRDGKIRYAGFSFHALPDELDEILTKHPEVDFVQLQINYADWDSPSIASRACYEIARKHGKPVVIMEPVKGGMLAHPPKTVEALFKEAEPDSSNASWALRFAADLDGVLTVLSGMSSMEQMEDNLKTMHEFEHLSDTERKVLSKAQEEINAYPLIPCTGCNYCLKVCPKQIGVAGTFKAYNTSVLFEDFQKAESQLKQNVDAKGLLRAGECIECGACEKICPQHLPIREELKKSVLAGMG